MMTQIKNKILIIILFLLTNTIFSQQNKTCWPVFRGDKQFQGVSTSALPESFSLKWIYKTKEKTKSSPVICDNKIITATSEGTVFCLDMNGKEIWKVKKEATSFEAPPVYFNNSIYIGSVEGKFFALNGNDGSVEWLYKTDNQILGSANWYKIGQEQYIVFGCYDNNIYCLNPANGKLKWTYEADNYINGAPAISNNNIVFGGCDAFLHVIDPENGKPINKIQLETYIASSASIVNGNAYLGNYNGEFMSVDLEKAALNWKITLNKEASVISSPSVIDSKIIIGARDQRVHCLNATSGKKIWSFKTQGDVDASTIVDKKRVLACSRDGRVYLLDINNGDEIFSFDVGSAISGTPAVVDGLIVISADNGNVYGFKF